MSSLIRYDSKPELTRPILIECLPGIGNVGKAAGDYLADAVGAVKFATIYSKHFPPQVLLDENSVIEMASNELWFAKNVGKKDIIFLRGDFQGSTQEGQFELCREIFDICLSYDISDIVTLGGYGTGLMIDKPRVLGAVSDVSVKKDYEKIEVQFLPNDPQAGIIGASGLLVGLGKIYGIPAICLMGETSGYFVDHKSAMAVLNVLTKKLKIKIDTKELKEKSEHIDELTAKVKEFEDRNDKEDLRYFG